MGFADHLSRHPNSPPTGENMNENHVINIITSLKLTLFTRQRKAANQKARVLNAQNDVKTHSNWNKQKQRAFCHSQANKQSLFIKPLSKTNCQINNSNSRNSINSNKTSKFHPKQKYTKQREKNHS